MSSTALALAFALLQAPTQAQTPTPPSDPQALLEAFLADGRVPGVSVGVVRADGAVLTFCAGLADRDPERRLTPEDRMLAGSVGKTLVAATCLQLAAEERLDLDALVGELLGGEPWFERLPNAGTLTLRHLLAHRSGLARYVFEPAFVEALKADPDRVWKPAEQLAFVLDRPPLFAAGEGFAYSDTNYLLVGMAIERASGRALYDEVERRFLAPLELDGIVPSNGRRIARLAQGYAGERDPLGLPDEVLDEEGRFRVNPQFEWAGGGFATTARDLARWGHALYAGPALDEALRAQMLAGELAPQLGPGVRYGLGAFRWPVEGGEAFGHSGFFPGYMTELRHLPARGLTIAVQVNTSDPRALPRPLAALVEQLAAAL